MAMTQMAQDKIEQKTRAATERVAMGLDRFTRKMLSENQYMVHEVTIPLTSSLFFSFHFYCDDVQIAMREQELIELEDHVRNLEQTNLAMNEKLNAANIANNATFT